MTSRVALFASGRCARAFRDYHIAITTTKHVLAPRWGTFCNEARTVGGSPPFVDAPLRTLPSPHSRGQMQKTAETRTPATDEIADVRIVRKACQKSRDRNARLEARQVHSRAGMDAEPERNVTVRLARQASRSSQPALPRK